MLESFKSGKFTYKKLSLEEQKSRGILGRLTGIIADSSNPTRNGRLYSEELWEKVFENPLMQEKIKNRCVFGELGHPADRTETDMEKIAICLAEVPKKGADGKLYGVFDILDSPNGRILKSLCDYGCTIGVSSRGSGDTFVDSNGQESVDPDTYDCECWDAVLVPAVESARMQYVTESLDKTRYNKSLRDSLKESIDNASEDDKKIMKEALNDLGISLTEAVVDSEAVDIKSEVLEEAAMSYEEAKEYMASKGLKLPKDIYNMILELNGEPNDMEGSQVKKEESLDKNCSLKELIKKKNSLLTKLEKAKDEDTRAWIEDQLRDLDMEIATCNESLEDEIAEEPDCTIECATKVMEAYQNANKWLDIVKEFVYANLGCVFFSSYIHELAHTMPVRFDNFGDILHTVNMRIPYPATAYIPSEPTNIDEVFSCIFMTLDAIKVALNDFIKCTDEANHGMACAAEALLNDIEGEYPAIFRMQQEWQNSNGDMATFDKYVGQYVEHKDDLTESLNESSFIGLQGAIRDIHDNEDTKDAFIKHIKEKDFSNDRGALLDCAKEGNIERFDRYDSAVRKKFLDYYNDIKNESYNINEGTETLAVDNNKAMVEELQNTLKENARLEQEIINLQEKLSVCYTKEAEKDTKLESQEKMIAVLSESSLEARVLRNELEQLNESSKSIKEESDRVEFNNKMLSKQLSEAKMQLQDRKVKLNESINQSNDKVKSLQESITKKDSTIKSLNESVSKLNEELNSYKGEVEKLNENLATMKKDNELKQKNYSQKLNESKQLVEKYKNVATTSVNKYIEGKATTLGITTNEIKNRLPESYNFKDIDRVCESLQNVQINLNRLPFDTENMSMRFTASQNESLMPKVRNDADEISDLELFLLNN